MPSAYPDPFEVKTDGTHGVLTLLGEAQSYNPDGTINYGPLNLSLLSDTAPLPRLIPAPFLSATQPVRTEVDVTWTPLTPPAGTPPVSSWVVQRRSSTDNGSTFGAWAGVTGSPFAAATLTKSDTGLSTGTPEVVFQYRAAGVNADGQGDWSNVVARQWQGTPVSPPTAPTGFGITELRTTRASFSWAEVTDPTVTKHGLYQGGSLVVDNIDPAARNYDWTPLTPGSTHTNVRIARANLGPGSVVQWSPLSNGQTFTLPTEEPPAFTILTGCSDSDNDHGGTEAWDIWRCYTRSAMLARANATGALRPKGIAYSANGTPLGFGAGDPVGASTYTAIFNYCRSELDSFYYGGAGQAHSARWGIRLYWSNGNENSDKAPLTTPHTQAGIGQFVTSQQALYDACHYIDPTTGQRRYPDAYAGSDPTQEHERLGIVADWLHPSARYHDFVVWSMYPAGRGVNDATLSRNPRWDFPSYNEADRTKRQPGNLIRCFYRTKQAEAQARIDTGNPTRRLIIGCGEYGMASDPDDRATRPYFYVYAGIGSMHALALQYALQMDFACAWDNQTSDTAPHNILTDEPPSSDHLAQGNGSAKGNNATATNPSTATAWRNYLAYDRRRGGTDAPQWAGKPGDIDNFTGTPI